MTIWIGFPNRHAENIRIYIKLMGEGGFPTPLKTGASDSLRIMLRCVMLVEASASICATGYNQDLRRESIRFLQNSIDFYRFSWILIDFHVFRGVDAKVTHEKRETGENLTFKQSKYVKKISFQFCRIELPCR